MLGMCVRLVSHTARDIIRAHAYTDNVPLRLLASVSGVYVYDP